MKLLFSLLLAIAFISCSEDVKVVPELKEPTFCDCNELILDQDYQRYYLSDKEKPFTGECITYSVEGKKIFERNYSVGKYNGLVIFYHKNGKVKSTTEYVKNFMTGAFKTYSLDGDLLSHSIYLRSKLKKVVK